jgi:hypothetical protein
MGSFSLAVFAVAIASTVAVPTLSGVAYDIIGPFPEGNREQADPLTAFGDPFILHSSFAANRSAGRLFPSELADGGNVS